MQQKCDSYNTAQLQLLSDPEVETRLSQTPDTTHDDMSDNVSRQGSRGRPVYSSHSRQATRSAPPSALLITRDILESTSWPNSQTRQAHSVAPTGTQFTPSSSNSSSDSDPDDSMDTDEEVDFWGGESPRPRLVSPPQGQEMDVNDSSEEEYDESEDEDMTDDNDWDEDEADEHDQMEIFGHR
ncbi:hypothetical protein ACLMJK_007332 [Lecanora helva]